jgi:hypothetical protein
VPRSAAIGRDPNEIIRSVQVLVAAEDPGRSTASGSQDLPRMRGPAATRELLTELIKAGARHLVPAPIPPYPSVRWLADEIAEPVLAATG